MKRFLLGMMVVGGAASLGGCPVYSDDSSYAQCQTAQDCGAGYACTDRGECIPYEGSGFDASTSGASGLCGDCSVGTVCTLVGGSPQCVPLSGGNQPDSSLVVEASADGNVVDVAPAADVTQDSRATTEAGPSLGLCNADLSCEGTVGGRCIDGLCSAQSHLCSDGTQCLVNGDSCVDGVCVPPCGGAAPPCPAGYACDFNRGVCSVNPSVCSTSAECQGGAVCVENRCVAPCAAADAGAQCASGQVCVNGGCIPDQQARFVCQNDGNQGSLANACDPSSICLHGDCYPACDAEGGACADPGESCKSVTIAKGTYAVCASATSLGSECNAAVGDFCTSPTVCVNGYCK